MNEIQQIQIRLMELSSFNEFDGKKVAHCLRAHEHLWNACLFTRDGEWNLITLRDMRRGSWNCDTLYILSSGKDDALLEELANDWSADAIEWLSEDESRNRMGGGDGRVLSLWWD